MEILQPDEMAYFKQLLTQQLDDLLNAAERTVGSLVRSESQVADPLDQAAMDTDRDTTYRIRDRESRLIRKIKTALSKIEEGSFGVCELCGEEITLARLKARPVTSYCIRCKTRLEAFEKVSGMT